MRIKIANNNSTNLIKHLEFVIIKADFHKLNQKRKSLISSRSLLNDSVDRVQTLARLISKGLTNIVLI